jgi:hypothetical protein
VPGTVILLEEDDVSDSNLAWPFIWLRDFMEVS